MDINMKSEKHRNTNLFFVGGMKKHRGVFLFFWLKINIMTTEAAPLKFKLTVASFLSFTREYTCSTDEFST